MDCPGGGGGGFEAAYNGFSILLFLKINIQIYS